MRIAKPGWKFILAGLALASVGFIPGLGRLGCVLGCLGLGFAGFCAYFFRDPERHLAWDHNKIYSPGDGRVLSVGQEGPGDIVTLRIFLSPLDVHIQRAPISGRVDKVHYQKGTFRMAMKKESAFNERNVIRIIPAAGSKPVVVEQIAGFLARRIACWVQESQEVRVGSRIGMIYLGSQVAIHFHGGVRVLARPGDRVVGGITAIGEWIQQN